MSTNLSCYHGSICRADAENILEKIKITGAFLVRNSETFVGSYTLCLWADNGYHQYRIINDGDGVFVKAEAGVEETKYPSLIHLIEYYQNQNSANGLAAPLKIPVPVESSETVYDLKKSTEVKEILACYFQHKFRYERHSRFDTTFYYLLERYLESGLIYDLKDIENTEIRPNEISNFRKLVFDSMKTLFESVNDMIEKLNFLNSFFCISEEERNYKLNLDGNQNLNLETLMDLSSFLRTIESNIISSFNNRLRNSKNNHPSDINGLISHHHNSVAGKSIKNSFSTANDTFKSSIISPIKTFEIEFSNAQSSMLQVICKVSLDILQGKIKFELLHTKKKTVLKPIILDCDSIENISKCDNNSQRLLIKESSINGYLSIDFSNETDRDEFIYCVCGMKRLQNIKANKINDCLSIFVGTWNTGASKSVEHLSHWLKCEGSGKPEIPVIGQYVPHDMYIIAFQEGITDQHFDAIISSTLAMCYNQDFPLISSQTNSFPKTLKLSVFCRAALEKYFRNISVDVVNTGFANKCGNKGAVSISFNFQDASFCFINCHLASGADKVKRREEEFKAIIQKMHLQRDRSQCADLISKHDFVFCMGDFNMRTDLHVTEAMKLLQSQHSHDLLNSDELLKYHLSKHWNLFKIFKEPPIFHRPTYRYLRGTRDNLDPFKQKIGTVDKINSPSWCDRVLYKSRNKNSILNISYDKNTEYSKTTAGINLDYKSSDHKPVFSSFLVDLPPRDYLINNVVGKPPSCLRIDEILIQIAVNQGKPRRQFYIQIESALLSDIYTSTSPYAICETAESRIYTSPQSKLKDMIPILDLNQKIALLFINPFKQISLKTGVSKRDIENGYILVSLIWNDNKPECIGNCVLPLKQFLTFQVGTLEDNLMEHSVPVGSMIIRAQVDARLFEAETNNRPVTPKLMMWYQNSIPVDESISNCRRLIDFVNDLDSTLSISNTSRLSNLIQNKELSAFRTIQSECNSSFHTVRNMSTRPNNFGEIYYSQMSKINGLSFSSSMRVTKNKDNCDYIKERQNFSDESCNSSKYSSHTVCKSKLCDYRIEQEEDNTIRKQSNVSDESSLMTVHNESYSAAIIRGGVSNKKRNMDARVDLSKLETDMINIQPPLPPRNARKNVRPMKTRQEHSNPISIVSSSGSTYNANSIGDSSIASAGASCCLLNPDLEFEDTSNDTIFHEVKRFYRTDNSSKQSTITCSNNHLCSLSGQYVQAVPAVSTEDIVNHHERLIEPYASTKITDDFNDIDQSKLSNEIEYVMLQKPFQIKEWLTDLGIPQKYIMKLLSSSFDNIDSIIYAKDEDLKSAGISEINCRRRILEGITSLRKEIAQ